MAALTAARYEFDLSRLRFPAVALLVGGVVAAHLPEAWGLPCPLRATTGVPCPFCGTTTSVRAALAGHLGMAAAAAPLGLLVIVVALCGVLASARSIPGARCGAGRLLAAEWVFELHRFHVFL